MTAATLQQISDCLFVLGLGSSTPQIVEGWHDICFTRAATQLRKVTDSVRALPAGEHMRLAAGPEARPLRLGQPPVVDLPIWIAAAGEPRAGRTIRSPWRPGRSPSQIRISALPEQSPPHGLRAPRTNR
jgi:5,10-methylenetetrahydromethanopterin reductase